jgi:uncharacterized protein YjbI with pentapeptide repeats
VHLPFRCSPDPNLSSAYLCNADLSGAGAILSDAILTGMNNFSAKQIKSAKNWRTATFNGKRLDDPKVIKQLGLDTKL